LHRKKSPGCADACRRLDQVLAPLPIGFAVFMVHLATIPITGTGINPARSLGAAVVYNNSKAWSDQVLHLSTSHIVQDCSSWQFYALTYDFLTYCRGIN